MSGVVKTVKGVAKGIFGGAGEAEAAAEAQVAGTQAGIEEQRRQFDITQEQLAPFREAGLGALEQQQALLGLRGEEAGAQALARFQESPGQRFLRERQERALLRNQAAIGGLGGGNIRTALQEQAAGIAGTQLGQFQNQLAGLSGTGQTAATQIGQLGAQTAGNIANLQGAAGQARASGILGAQQANAGLGGQLLGAGLGAAAGGGLLGSGAAKLFGGSAGVGGLVGLLSDMRLKQNIEKVGELPSGLAWYKWEWTDEGKMLAGDQMTSGVMAQEAKEMFPDSVEEVDGFLRVNYKEIH